MRTDEKTGIIKPIVAFRNFANAPNTTAEQTKWKQAYWHETVRNARVH